ncbi:MEDIATOR OF RNA POLYMERASE II TRANSCRIPTION SUBUNIT 12 [Ceraceosorus bombacis]|uniref:Mediator of RNA polymerase II transcription subunit 12 n=1 Tax=Ceraceosorus bombacis TaxID=401625 RepID=A0A0P1BRL9_9BASI|nr:MEDIATOR OF RNA POLYMERASE II TRANSCRIPTION SUBUNIT 12 [Ceraceosorus bombacis]
MLYDSGSSNNTHGSKLNLIEAGSSPAAHLESSTARPGPSSAPITDFGPAINQGPTWRPRLHPGSTALGKPDFFPPDTDAEQLTEQVIRLGITNRPAVGNETMTANDMIYDRLTGANVLDTMGSMMDEILMRREELQRDKISSSSHRAPPRVTLNEVKLAAYMRDLGDPSVPLQRLARSVPHGYRGERMLDMLWMGGVAPTPASSSAAAAAAARSSATASQAASVLPQSPRNPVELHRAVWFIRVVGASEISSSRARQNSNYTAEWTSTFNGWLRKQLAELNIAPTASMYQAAHSSPASPAPTNRTPAHARSQPIAASSPYSASANGHSLISSRDSIILQQPDLEARWFAKWEYSIGLAQALVAESLLDIRVFALWIFEQLGTASLAQLPFVLTLAQEHAWVALDALILQRALLQSLCSCITELRKAELPEDNKNTHLILKEACALVRFLFDSDSDAFVSPKLWSQYGATIRKVVDDSHDDVETSRAAAHRREKLNNIDRRAQACLLGDLVVSSDEVSASRCDVELLDDFSVDDLDVEALADAYFARSKAQYSIQDKLCNVLIWATTQWRSGQHRPLLAARLVWTYHSRSQDASARLAHGWRAVDLQTVLFDWLSSVDKAQRDRGNPPSAVLQSLELESVIILVGELIRLGCFSFSKYLQRLTARGMTAGPTAPLKGTPPGSFQASQASSESEASLHQRVLRSVPLAAATPALSSQRRSAIYGTRLKESHEEASERRLRRELSNALPWLHGASPQEGNNASSSSVWKEQVPHLWSASRFTLAKVITSDLMPSIHSLERSLTVDEICILEVILAHARDHVALSQLLSSQLLLLAFMEDSEALEVLTSCICKHALCFAALDTLNQLSSAVSDLYIQCAGDDISPWGASCSEAFQRVAALRNLRRHISCNREEEQTSASKGHCRTESRPSGHLHDQFVEIARRLASDLDVRAAMRSVQAIAGPIAGQSILSAALHVVSEGASDGATIALVQWVRHATWTASDLHTVLRSWASQSEHNAANEGSELFLLRCVASGALRMRDLYASFVLPALELEAEENGAPPIEKQNKRSIKVATVAAIIKGSSSPRETSAALRLDSRHRLRLEAESATVTGSIGETSLLFRVLVLLLHLPNHDAAVLACNELLSNLSVRCCIMIKAFELFSIVSEVSRSVWGSNPSQVLSQVFASVNQAGLSTVNPSSIDAQMIFQRLDPWRCNLTVAEIAHITGKVATADASEHLRSQNALTSLSVAIFEPLCLASNSSLQNQLIRHTKHISTFQGRLVDLCIEELLRHLHSSSRRAGPTHSWLHDSLQTLAQVLHSQTRASISPHTLILASQLLNAIAAGFEITSSSRDCRDLSLIPLDVSVRASLGCARLAGLWTSADARSTAPRLLEAMCACAVNCSLEALNDFDVIVDAMSALMEDMPPDCVSSAQTSISSILAQVCVRSAIPDFAQARLQALAMPATITTQTHFAGATSDIILASSMTSAAVKGNFSQAPFKAWELHDHMDADTLSRAQARLPGSTILGGGSATSHPPSVSMIDADEVGYAAVNLANSGSVSLLQVGAVKTRERVASASGLNDYMYPTRSPHTSIGADEPEHWAAHESERTYGEGRAGDTTYARDARTGSDLLALDRAREDGGEAALIPEELRAADRALAQRALAAAAAEAAARAAEEAVKKAEAAAALAAAAKVVQTTPQRPKPVSKGTRQAPATSAKSRKRKEPPDSPDTASRSSTRGGRGRGRGRGKEAKAV